MPIQLLLIDLIFRWRLRPCVYLTEIASKNQLNNILYIWSNLNKLFRLLLFWLLLLNIMTGITDLKGSPAHWGFACGVLVEFL